MTQTREPERQTARDVKPGNGQRFLRLAEVAEVLNISGSQTYALVRSGDLIAIKIGLHAGACLAVTLNDRLDYFGQTVNIAARVQGMAGADEILVTDDVLGRPGALAVVGDFATEASDIELKGVSGMIKVHRIHR